TKLTPLRYDTKRTDRIFDPNTEAALRNFQKHNNLPLHPLPPPNKIQNPSIFSPLSSSSYSNPNHLSKSPPIISHPL
ncbi:peptidoglycan-binding domain-containing protein, partial [Priestia megaterium]|uniref:peptidoglycan-binding domain-containing protein n=1 Tax=Priestia megaterium TaxID=1404 RepID=UPI0012B9987D